MSPLPRNTPWLHTLTPAKAWLALQNVTVPPFALYLQVRWWALVFWGFGCYCSLVVCFLNDVAKDNPELLILLPATPKCWGQRHVPLHSVLAEPRRLTMIETKGLYMLGRPSTHRAAPPAHSGLLQTAQRDPAWWRMSLIPELKDRIGRTSEVQTSMLFSLAHPASLLLTRASHEGRGKGP